MILISAIVSVGATVALTSTGVLNASLSENDSLKIVNAVEDIVSPKYTDSDQFIVDSKNDVNMLSALSIINTMEPSTIAIIADKAIASYGYVDYTAFINTYQSNKDVFDSANGTLSKAPLTEYSGLQQKDDSKADPPVEQKVDSTAGKSKGLTIHINGD